MKPRPLKKSVNEQTYTSTDEKLLAGGLDRLLEFQQKGMLRPQSLQLCPEDACQMDCTFCSTKYRNWEGETIDGRFVPKTEKKTPDYIPFDDINGLMRDLIRIGPIKTVELSGAGDPSMYRDRKTGHTINEVIDLLTDHFDLQVGMITNGMGLTKLVGKEQLNKLTWLRVSLASFDPQNFHNNNDGMKNHKYQDKFPDLPERLKGKLGFSYVWGPHSRPEVLDKIADYAKTNQVDFVRIVPDCLDVEKQHEFRENVRGMIADYNKKIGRDVMFFQSKRYDVHSSCRIGFLKPYANADGYLYHCSAVPLYHQKFMANWRMGSIKEVDKIWTPENISKGFNTSSCEYGKCFLAPQNEILDAVKKQGVHRDFL